MSFGRCIQPKPLFLLIAPIVNCPTVNGRVLTAPYRLLVAVLLFALVSQHASAVVVINDDFSDGARSRSGSLDIDWYAIGGTFSNNSGIKPGLSVVDDSAGSGTSTGLQSGNALRAEGGGTNSGEFMGRFPSTVTLGETVGDKVVMSFDWRLDDADEVIPSQARLTFGIFGDTDDEFGTTSILSPAGSLVNRQFADFDGDLDADGDDFLTWQRNQGTSSGATITDGDINFDGAVDGLDLFNTIVYSEGNENENTVEYGWSADYGTEPVVWGSSDGQFERCGSPYGDAPGTCGDLGVVSRIQFSDDAQWSSFPAFQPTGENNRIIAEANVNNILGGSGDNQTMVNPSATEPTTPLTLQKNGVDITPEEYDEEAYLNGSVEEYHIVLSMERAAEDPTQPGVNVNYSLSITDPNGDTFLMESYEQLPETQTDLDTPVEFDYVIFNNVSANYDQMFDNFMIEEIITPAASALATVPEPSALLLAVLSVLATTACGKRR